MLFFSLPGHDDLIERLIVNTRKEKRSIQRKTWYQENRERLLERMHDYDQAHREERKPYFASWRARNRAKAKDWYWSHRADALQKNALWRAENTKKRKAWRQQYNAAHRQDAARFNAIYRATHKPQRVAYQARRRARQTGAGGSFTAEEFEQLCLKFGNKCIGPGPHGVGGLEADHVVPISRGGHSNISNIQPLCHACNMQKFDQSTDYRGDWNG